MIFNEALLLSLLGLWNKKLKEKRKWHFSRGQHHYLNPEPFSSQYLL